MLSLMININQNKKLYDNFKFNIIDVWQDNTVSSVNAININAHARLHQKIQMISQ